MNFCGAAERGGVGRGRGRAMGKWKWKWRLGIDGCGFGGREG